VLIAVVSVPLLSSKEASTTLQPLVFWFMLTLLVLFLATLPIGTTMMAVAREGGSIALLRSLPVSMSEVLKGKFWASWLPVAAWWTAVLLVAGLLLRWPWWQLGAVAILVIWATAGASAAATAMGGLTVDFAREELKQRISTTISYLQMALNLLFALLCIGSCLWLIVRLFPEDQTVLVLRTLSQYRFVGWLYSASPWIPLILVGVQGAFWIGVKILWRAAVQRLERWELAAE
jgi:ABC-2 type transport system permease protein